MRYRNAAFAFVRELEQIKRSGRPVTVRGSQTQELLARAVSLQNPLERFITVPSRRNNPFATIAETMWVLAGRSDMTFLSKYLERASDYSDDGEVWRAGYGPRLRAWGGVVDQVDEVRKLLTADPASRRAVAVLYDPAQDFVNESKDVPCNNWLHFMVRDGRLDLDIVIRSNDVLWGFSGINTFEWSVLHDAMAFWLNVEVGAANFFISSLHLYDRHDERAKSILATFDERSGYESGWAAASFATPWEHFNATVAEWFQIEEAVSNGDEDVVARVEQFSDPLLRDFLRAIRIKWRVDHGAREDEVRGMIGALGKSDVAFAITEWLYKDSRLVLDELDAVDSAALTDAIVELHRVKDASYTDSWKRRGEQVSILANIARKSDRIENLAGGAPAGNETLLDTAIDLYVYAIKYETFLADEHDDAAVEIFGRSGARFSDGPGGFEALVRERGLNLDVRAVAEEARSAVSDFDQLDRLVREGSPSVTEKTVAARRLSDQAGRLVVAIARSTPDPISAIRNEIGQQ